MLQQVKQPHSDSPKRGNWMAVVSVLASRFLNKRGDLRPLLKSFCFVDLLLAWRCSFFFVLLFSFGFSPSCRNCFSCNLRSLLSGKPLGANLAPFGAAQLA
jgi:hypothetical protein